MLRRDSPTPREHMSERLWMRDRMALLHSVCHHHEFVKTSHRGSHETCSPQVLTEPNRVWLCYTGVINQPAKLPEYLPINTTVCTLFFNSTRASYIEIQLLAIGFLFPLCNRWILFQRFSRASSYGICLALIPMQVSTASPSRNISILKSEPYELVS